jgi:plasmid stabilization system protein ParE
MAEYRLSPAAERDLESIWKYTRAERGVEQAERYTDLLAAAFQVLAESPKSAMLPMARYIPSYSMEPAKPPLHICSNLPFYALPSVLAGDDRPLQSSDVDAHRSAPRSQSAAETNPRVDFP